VYLEVPIRRVLCERCGKVKRESLTFLSDNPFYKWLGPKKSKGIKIAVIDMWKPFLKSTKKKGHAPQATILFDKFHVIRHLGEALDKVRRSEYHRLSGKDKAFVKGHRYTLLSR
jgi:transposase